MKQQKMYLTELLKEFINLNVNMDTIKKKYETCKIKYKACDFFLEYTNFKDHLIEHKCFFMRIITKKKYNENFKKRFLNTYKV